MPYNLVADGFHTKKLCGRLPSSEMRFWPRKRPFCALEPPKGGLGITYDVQLGLIGKCVVDFLLVLIEFFSLGVTADAL